MVADNGIGDRQTETGAAAPGGVEGGKELLSRVLADAGATVGDRHRASAGTGDIAGNRQFAAARHDLQGINDEIGKDLPELIVIADDHGGRGVVLAVDGVAIEGDLMADSGENFVEKLRRVNAAEVEIAPP